MEIGHIVFGLFIVAVVGGFLAACGIMWFDFLRGKIMTGLGIAFVIIGMAGLGLGHIWQNFL